MSDAFMKITAPRLLSENGLHGQISPRAEFYRLTDKTELEEPLYRAYNRLSLCHKSSHHGICETSTPSGSILTSLKLVNSHDVFCS
jgi:hypothetical protein